MEVNVTNTGVDYHAEATSGMVQDIVFGPEKPAEDTTMNPVELFAAALGMCVAAMLRKHCNERDLECGEIKVDVEGDWEPGDPWCESMKVSVDVEGDWDERRRAAFLKVAETCPVHQTIANCGGVDIEIA